MNTAALSPSAQQEFWAIVIGDDGQPIAIGSGLTANEAWTSCDETAGPGFDLTRTQMEAEGYRAVRVSREQYDAICAGDIYLDLPDERDGLPTAEFLAPEPFSRLDDEAAHLGCSGLSAWEDGAPHADDPRELARAFHLD